MQFFKLAEFLERLEKTSSRNEITVILAELFREAGEKDIDKICYLVLGKLVPSFRGIEFNLAEKLMIQILAKAFNREPAEINRFYKEKGDLGDVVAQIRGKRRTGGGAVSVSEAYGKLMEIALESGSGSQERKITKTAKLLSELDARSAKYIVRIPVGKLRLGFSDATILDALSVMERKDKSARSEVERAFNVTADIGVIARKVKIAGIKSLAGLKARPGIPIRPSLAERIPTAQDIIKKLGPVVAVEPKLDGFRIAIHIWPVRSSSLAKAGAGKKAIDGKQVVLFSRNLENTTLMFPEIVEAAKKISVKSAILDGEAIGYNPKTDQFVPFQETVQRKRKYDIAAMAKKMPLKVFVFDVLYLNGKSLLDLRFAERRKILEKIFAGHKENTLHLNEQKLMDDPIAVEKELQKTLTLNLEGLVAKNLNSKYEAGSRGFHWVKFKAGASALSGARAGKKILLDTIDCVVMGIWRGRGKRAGFGVGGFLLGVRDKDGKYYTISRLGTGLSDEQFREAHRRIEKIKTKEAPKDYAVFKETAPDVWVSPSLVLEILSDEITLSPRHTAGNPAVASAKGGSASGGKATVDKEGGRGYSLRFPRLVRFRDDKNPEDITTVSEIEKMYKAQNNRV